MQDLHWVISDRQRDLQLKLPASIYTSATPKITVSKDVYIIVVPAFVPAEPQCTRFGARGPLVKICYILFYELMSILNKIRNYIAG